MKLYDLMTDNRRENILVGSKKPVFSWRVETEKGMCTRKAIGCRSGMSREILFGTAEL